MMIHREKGIALVTALAILVVVALLVFGSAYTTQIELWVTRNDVTATQATYIAEAGVQDYKAKLFQYFRWVEDHSAAGSNPDRTVCFNRMSKGIDWNRDGTVEPWTGQVNGVGGSLGPFTHTVTDVNGNTVGTYEIRIRQDPVVPHFFTVRSVGKSAGATATVSATFEIRNSGILEQAIFAGEGQSNTHVNGGVTIRGGIYVIGSDPNETVIDANGNFAMYNHYNMNDYATFVADKVKAEDQVASNLCATLRVQNGKVQAGGSTLIGQPDNKLLGVYVGRGEQDISGTAADVCKENRGICSDPPPTGFDIAEPPDFPTFDGEPGPDCVKAGHTTWRACIHDTATTPGEGLRIVYGSPPTISWPDTTTDTTELARRAACESAMGASRELVLNTQVIDCTYTLSNGVTAGFSYDGTVNPGKLTVYGSVNLDGYDLILAKDTAYAAQTEHLEGTAVAADNNASLVVEDSGNTTGGDIEIRGNLLPDTDDFANGHFPDHVLGLIVEEDGYQKDYANYVMAPIYVGGTYRNVKDNVLFGSVVANVFCTTGAGNESWCNAGQKSEIVYINTGNNKPAIMRQVDKAGIPTFKVISYERR